MSYLEEISGDIYYLVEIEAGGEKLYMHTKRTALHFPDMGRRFVHKRSAQRYYKGSEFDKMNCAYRIVKYCVSKGTFFE